MTERQLKTIADEVQPQSALGEGDPFWEMMHSIWAGQQLRGHVPRSSEEVEAERQDTREQWNERQRAIELLQDESRRLRNHQS